MQDRKLLAHDLFYSIKEDSMKGMSIREASEELQVSERTVFRMLEDNRLQGKKIPISGDFYIWEIDPVSVARLQVKKEMSGKSRYK